MCFINAYYFLLVSPSPKASWKSCLSPCLVNAALFFCNLHSQEVIISGSCKVATDYIHEYILLESAPNFLRDCSQVGGSWPTFFEISSWLAGQEDAWYATHQVPRIAAFRREVFFPPLLFWILVASFHFRIRAKHIATSLVSQASLFHSHSFLGRCT